MNRDHIEGGIRTLRGRAKTAAGAVLGHPGRQVDGAIDQVAGAAQVAYGRARDTAEGVARDGRHLAKEARDQAHDLYDDVGRRGRRLYEEVGERGRHVRRRAEHHGRALAARADDNRVATLALVGAVAFGLGLLVRRAH